MDLGRRQFFATLLAPLVAKALPPVEPEGLPLFGTCGHRLVEIYYIPRYSVMVPIVRWSKQHDPDAWPDEDLEAVAAKLSARLRAEEEKFVTDLFTSNPLQNHR
jgi:hypothetical protein